MVDMSSLSPPGASGTKPPRKHNWRGQGPAVQTDSERTASRSLQAMMEERETHVIQQHSLASPPAEGAGMDVFQRWQALLTQVRPATLVTDLALPLAMDCQGCRLLQEVLEVCSSAERKALALEMRGYVRAASESPHANHVMQRFIELLPPAALRFVVPELARSWNSADMARHKFGCRVLERLVEHFTACSPSCEELAEFLRVGALQDVGTLCFHMYGNFVMQHLLEHGSHEQKSVIVRALRGNLRKVALHEYAALVLGNALSYVVSVDRQSLAAELLRMDDLFQPKWIMSRNGELVLDRLFSFVHGPAHLELVSKLQGHMRR